MSDTRLQVRKKKREITDDSSFKQVADVLGENNPQQSEIKELLERIDEQKDYTLSVMNLLEVGDVAALTRSSLIC